jgi:hypothetical protein
VINDEATGLAEALRTAVAAISVAAQDQQIGAFSGSDHLAFNVTGKVQHGARTG